MSLQLSSSSLVLCSYVRLKNNRIKNFSTDSKPAIPSTYTRTFKGIDFKFLADANIFQKFSSGNEDQIKEANDIIATFYNDCFNTEFGVSINFTSPEHAGKTVSSSKEGKAWNIFYRKEYSFFMSTYEQFSHLDLTKAEIEKFKKDQERFTELKKLVSKEQTMMSERHEKERKDTIAKLYDFVTSNNKFLAVMMVSEENLTVKQQLLLQGIIDEKVRKAEAKKMVAELQKQVLADARQGLPAYFTDLFGL